MLGPVARSDARPPGMQTVAGLILGVQQHSFVEIGHESISMAILSLPLIQVSDCRFGVSPVNYPDPDPEVRQLSVTGIRMCT